MARRHKDEGRRSETTGECQNVTMCWTGGDLRCLVCALAAPANKNCKINLKTLQSTVWICRAYSATYDTPCDVYRVLFGYRVSRSTPAQQSGKTNNSAKRKRLENICFCHFERLRTIVPKGHFHSTPGRCCQATQSRAKPL